MRITKSQLEHAWWDATGLSYESPLHSSIINEALEATEPDHERDDVIRALEAIIDDILMLNGKLLSMKELEV